MAEPVFMGMPQPLGGIAIDGRDVEEMEGSTILDACRRLRIDTPTLCQLDNLTPVNVCRVCVVELEGSRVLVPACSRKVEAGMKIATDSERVRHSRRLVLEFLASSVDMSLCSPQVHGWLARYGATPARFGTDAATVAQPVKIDNDLYVRDYSRCILELQVQDNSIVKVTSPMDHSVTAGHLCVKGRFGFQFVQRRRS